uniref:Cytochrome c oxidase subunit 2 n=1 Tax=Semnoderes armiger TaxID=1415233 RepID=A0A5H2QAG8_9BILA|nr:cytochrome c oxidase subunit II [Semnoderes armiger]AYF57119.1 cytochrome c oxidase subunit 2 [Semnoderes armiger]
MIFFNCLWLQDPMNYLCSNLFFFFNFSMLIVVLICFMVLFWMMKIIKGESGARLFIDHENLEIWWTCFPLIILILIGVPSMRILYEWDCQPLNSLSLKVLGYQWYWGYEYKSLDVSFDSFIKQFENLNSGSYRVMEVDNRMIVPGEVSLRMLVTSKDVLHSWAIPSMSVKIDAIPGRLNSIRLFFLLPGVYYGQCSELCGVGHALMPIVVEVVSWSDFINWVNKML